MGENKKKEESRKLTYEQLEAYASQIGEESKRLYQENQMLKRALYDNNLKEVEIALKCLEHTDKFSANFIEALITKIEEVINPYKDKEEK